MDGTTQAPLIGRRAELSAFESLRRQVERDGADFLCFAGSAGSGKSHLLRVCAERARLSGWEVLYGQCTWDTRADPYGPLLSLLGLCFDKAGRLINDRSVHSIVDQLSLDDVFDAIADLPGMSVVAFGIKVGLTIFESRRRPLSGDALRNRNFEFIRQLFVQIERKRAKPVLLVLDDLHLAGETTYALLEYIVRRTEGTRLLVVGAWTIPPGEDDADLRRALKGLVVPAKLVPLTLFSARQLRRLSQRFTSQSLPDALVNALLDFSRGLPGVMEEGLRLAARQDDAGLSAFSQGLAGHSVLQILVERQVGQLSEEQRTLLECAALIGQQAPVDVLCAQPLCSYLGIGERRAVSIVADLADRGTVLTWDGEGGVRFASAAVRDVLSTHTRSLVQRRDHLHIASAWKAVFGDARPAQLARHYLAGGDVDQAVTFSIQHAEELCRSAAYPEAIASYQQALDAVAGAPGRADGNEVKCSILHAMAIAAEQTGDWDQSLARLQQTLDLCSNDVALEAEVHAGMGWLHTQRGQVQAALYHLEHSAGLYESVQDRQGRTQINYYLGVLYSQQKQWQRAAEYFERYLAESEGLETDGGRSLAYIELGNLYRMQQEWARAEALLEQGIDLAQAAGDYAVLAQGYHYLGNCYARQNRGEAVDVLRQALDIVRTRTKQPAQVARIQNTLAETLVRLNRWEEAEAAFQASVEIKKRLGDRAGLAMSYGGLGRLYLRQWRFDLAVDYLKQDIDLLSQEFEANVAWIQQHTNLIGEARRLQGQLDKAQRHIEAAMVLADRIPDEGVQGASRGYSHMLLANLALDRNDLELADRECLLAVDLLSGTWAEGEVQRTAARLARHRGDLETAQARMDLALCGSRDSEDIDRAQCYLEQAHLSRELGQEQELRDWVARVVTIAQQLLNPELERRANSLLAVE